MTDDMPTGRDYEREKSQVKALAERVKRARDFDKPARKQYALDRRYARGDSGFMVDANIIGSFIDVLSAFLYAKQPDVDVMPALSAEPPSVEAMEDAAEGVAVNPLEVQGRAIAHQAAGLPPIVAMQQAQQDAQDSAKQAAFEQLQQAYQRRQRNNKAFADTLELVVSRLWSDARLKHRGKPWVRSALTIGPGWLKSTWQERMGEDPVMRTQIDDLQRHINIAVAQKQALEEGDASGEALDELISSHNRQMQILQEQVERVVARGFVADFVAGEDITVAPGVDLENYLDAPWIDHRIPMRFDDAVAQLKLNPEKAKKATRFTELKPVMRMDESPLNAERQVTADDADRFKTSDTDGGSSNTGDESESCDWVMVHETWDLDEGCYKTWIEGMECFARPPITPSQTTRFYPFFLFGLGFTDGQRHPQSLGARSRKLVDEYYRIRSQETKHRKRLLPKTLFVKGSIDPDSVDRVTKTDTGELVGVDLTNPMADARSVFLPLQYPQIDPALYDTSKLLSELERIWGVQEALMGAVQVAKTATEAQIQSTGQQARTGAMRDALEDSLTELALYTAEVARANMSLQDVQDIVGPDAMWPPYEGGEDLGRLVNVNIVAGSSGKPNTTAERQAWATLLPMLQQMGMQIGQLRNSQPTDMADMLEELVRITAERSGDRIDVQSLLPKAGPPPLLPPGMPGVQPGQPQLPAPPAGAPAEPMTNPA